MLRVRIVLLSSGFVSFVCLLTDLFFSFIGASLPELSGRALARAYPADYSETWII